MVSVGESKVVPFEGTYLRTSAITGQVTVEGNPLENVTVSMQGRGEDETVTTNGAGQFTFSELRSGDYAVGITNPDDDQYSFEVTSQTVTVAHGETATVPFDGTLLRTAGVTGTVTIEGTGLPGVTVTINGQGEEHDEVTNATGYYAFSDLHAGDYTIGITGYDDDEYEFEATSQTVRVELQETATAPFDGIMLRTAGIEGTVTVEGHALPGVMVTVSGGPKGEEHTRTTNDAGYYMVDRLHAGDYAVAISDFDANEYEFPGGTTTTITVALRTTETVAFQGDLLRTAGISGRVSVEGVVGLDGIMVTLSGDADATDMTKDGGQYAFTGLAEGDYMVAIAGWDDAAYTFTMAEAEVPVGDGAAVVQNFDGVHTRTASVSGMLFLDEVDGDGMYTDGEPALAHAGVPLLLQGPGVNDVQFGISMEDGSYSFDSLMAGSYRVLINVTEELTAMLTAGGFRYAGELTGAVVNVDAAMAATVNFPFRIVMQTILAGAVTGTADATGYPVAGVELELYATAEDLAAGTNILGAQTTDEMGGAKFDFPRTMDLGPGGQGTDHLVYVKVTGTGHDDLVVTDNNRIEIEYAATDRVAMATTAVRLLNLGVNFQWWVKSNETAKDGNEFLEGWAADNGMETGADGKATYSGRVDLADAGTTMMVLLAEDDQPDMGEVWTQSDALTYTHNPLALPALNGAEMNDLGAIYVTYTTQQLVLGVYRETDDVDGFTNYVGPVAGGDHRPADEVGAQMTVELMVRDSRNRLQTLMYDDDLDDETAMVEARGDFSDGGMLTIEKLPADEEITVRFRMGSSERTLVSYHSDIETFGEDLRVGSNVGAFGAMSGGGPQVRLCTASENTDEDGCATYGYQWTTGTISGTAGEHSGNDVSVVATTGQGATGASGETGADGAYALTGLQDGTYDATAANNNSDYSLDGTPTRTGIELYHDEAAWVEANADDEDDIEYDGDEEAEVNWTVTRIGLKLMGYVGNDSNGDKLARGDESIAGVELTLKTGMTKSATTGVYSGGTTVGTAITDGSGYYSFGGLIGGTTYFVVASSGSGYRAVRALTGNTNVIPDLKAGDYPALPSQGTYALPVWDYTTKAATNTTVDIAPGDAVANLHNFALVYEDGAISGAVNNMSGESGNIDVRISSDVFDGVMEDATLASGSFGLSDVLEGSYSAVIEDAGFAAPLLGDDGVPDDDAACLDEDGISSVDCETAPTTITGDTRGRQDHASMGTLHVYSTTAGDDDDMTAVEVTGVVAPGGDEVDLADGQTYSQSGDTSTSITLSNTTEITWASESVTVEEPTFTDEDATMVVMMGDDVCPGGECELDYTATDAETGAGTAVATAITIMVTAENGYNDHAYTFDVSRAAPEGNELVAASITASDGTTGATSGGSGTQEAPWQAATATDDDEVTVTIGLQELGTGADAYCTQSVAVKVYNGDDVDAEEDTEDDGCDGEQYTIEAGTLYEITVSSEDGIDAEYYLLGVQGT